MDTPKRVLIVDDDEFVRYFVQAALSEHGYDVIEAINGAAALTLLQSQEPDLILLDMRTPIMDGWQFSAAYRAARPEPPVPIVLLTASTDPGSCAAQVQAQDFLSKPFDVHALLDCVAQYAGTAD